MIDIISRLVVVVVVICILLCSASATAVRGDGTPDTEITSVGPGSFHKDKEHPQDACCG